MAGTAASAADPQWVEGGGAQRRTLVMTSEKGELAEIEDKIKRTKLSKEAREKARHELDKLRQMSPISAQASVVRNYLDWLLSIPWNTKTKVKKDLAHAQEILDNDHYGLEKVKERIVEQLAVQQRVSKLTGPVLS
jgi:ATP-dependent Lon protease